MADSMELMILSILSPTLRCEWDISPLQQSSITVSVFVGWMIGAPMWGHICDRFGRRVGLAASTLTGFTMGSASALAPNYWCFLVLRTLTGVGIGGLAQGVTLYSEFLPARHRARCIVSIKMFWAAGAACEAALALLIMHVLAMGWRWLIFFSSLPMLLSALSYVWVPESARYHFASGRPELARRTLERVARINGREMPKGKLVDMELQDMSINREARGKEDAVIGAKRGRLCDLFVADLAKSTLLLWFIWWVGVRFWNGHSNPPTRLS